MESLRKIGIELAATSIASIFVKAHSKKEEDTIKKRLTALELKLKVKPGERWTVECDEYREGLLLLTKREIDRCAT